MKDEKATEPKAKAEKGRPKMEFDLQRVEDFGYFKATFSTMASLLDCSVDTIRRNMRNTENDFSKAYQKGFANAKMALSEAQWKNALSGNVTMQIWLGRNYLGQTDQTEYADKDAIRAVEFEYVVLK